MSSISTAEQVKQIIGEPLPVSIKKIYDHLNPRMVEFINASPLLILSTIDEHGFPTASPKGDHAGFVKVSSINELLIPERKGNRLAFSLRNIVNNPKVALLFMVPGTTESLRIHGTCELINNAQINDELASPTQKALLALKVTVSNAYFHCGKALLRSQTWQPETWREKIKVSFGTEIAENLPLGELNVEEFDQGVAGRYVSDL